MNGGTGALGVVTQIIDDELAFEHGPGLCADDRGLALVSRSPNGTLRTGNVIVREVACGERGRFVKVHGRVFSGIPALAVGDVIEIRTDGVR